MRIVVTGGAGFIGCNLVRALLERDHEVIVVDDFSSGPRENLYGLAKPCMIEELDIVQDELGPAFHHADAVIHLAALGGVQPSVRDPLRTYRANVIGSIRVMDAALDADAHQVILASSSSIYGGRATPYFPSFREDLDPDNPRSPYAASKLAMEVLAAQYARLYDLPTVNLRFYNVYGPWQRANRGSFSAVVPSFIEAIRAGRPVKIYGNGEQSRDFTYVGDVVSAILSVLEHPTDMPKEAQESRVFNVANAEPKTLHTILSVLEMLMGVTAQVDYGPMREGDVMCSRGSPFRLNAWTGWEAKTTLAAGLAETLAWWRQSNG